MRENFFLFFLHLFVFSKGECQKIASSISIFPHLLLTMNCHLSCFYYWWMCVCACFCLLISLSLQLSYNFSREFKWKRKQLRMKKKKVFKKSFIISHANVIKHLSSENNWLFFNKIHISSTTTTTGNKHLSSTHTRHI